MKNTNKTDNIKNSKIETWEEFLVRANKILQEVELER